MSGPEPQHLADQMSSAWIAFARTGNPDNGAVADLGRPSRWPGGRRWCSIPTPRVVNDFRGDERALLASLPLYRVSR